MNRREAILNFIERRVVPPPDNEEMVIFTQYIDSLDPGQLDKLFEAFLALDGEY